MSGSTWEKCSLGKWFVANFAFGAMPVFSSIISACFYAVTFDVGICNMARTAAKTHGHYRGISQCREISARKRNTCPLCCAGDREVGVETNVHVHRHQNVKPPSMPRVPSLLKMNHLTRLLSDVIYYYYYYFFKPKVLYSQGTWKLAKCSVCVRNGYDGESEIVSELAMHIALQR